MNVKIKMNAPIDHDLASDSPARLMKPTINRLRKHPASPVRKIDRRPNRVINGHERMVPTKAIAY
jgi:hypothetical protein